MDSLTLPLLALAVIIVGSIFVKGIRDHARGTGGALEPAIRDQPSADAPTPARSATATPAEANQARHHTPPA